MREVMSLAAVCWLVALRLIVLIAALHVAFAIYSGYRLVTAQDEREAVQVKERLFAALVNLAVLVLALAAVRWFEDLVM
ncbi:hypothetical protein [Desulfofundulus kuznetsovii]|uniref:hypothetical protein n=1 Tax=Desulfofundulus kuznetsovii TaxID=58135 RepID=UPI00338DAACC